MTHSLPPSVLVVDDHPDTADTLAACLRACGYDARTAANGPAALKLLTGWAPDAAVLDVAMPGMDGYALADRLTEALPRRPVLIAVSGFSAPADRDRALAFGFDYHFAKPADPADLDAAIRAAAPAAAVPSSVR
jgi:CheY-like chemotaxis protein